MRYATVKFKFIIIPLFLPKNDTEQAAMIELMLSENPQKRPSAEQIAKTLKEGVEEDVTIPPLAL